MCFHVERDLIYILDFSTQSLLIFSDESRELNKVVSIFRDKSPGFNFEQAFSVSFTRELVAVNFRREEVHLYSIDSGLLHSVVSPLQDFISIHSIYLSQNGGLFMHFNDFFSDELVLYEKDQANSSYESKISMRISPDGRLKGSNKLRLCGENLIMTLWGKELTFF